MRSLITRRKLLRDASCATLIGVAQGSVCSTPATAFWFALIGRALAGYAARTVTANTARTAVTALSRPAAGRYAAAQSNLAARGYQQQSDFARGLYQGRGAGWRHHVPQAMGAIAEDAVKAAMEPGFGLIGGGGRPYGSAEDVSAAAFPNHQYEETPILGAPDIVGLLTLGHFVAAQFGFSDHEVTILTYPLQMHEYAEYDGIWNSYRPSVFRSGYSTIWLRSVGVGTENAAVICRMVEIGSGRSLYDRAVPLPPEFQRRWR